MDFFFSMPPYVFGGGFFFVTLVKFIVFLNAFKRNPESFSSCI